MNQTALVNAALTQIRTDVEQAEFGELSALLLTASPDALKAYLSSRDESLMTQVEATSRALTGSPDTFYTPSEEYPKARNVDELLTLLNQLPKQLALASCRTTSKMTLTLDRVEATGHSYVELSPLMPATHQGDEVIWLDTVGDLLKAAYLLSEELSLSADNLPLELKVIQQGDDPAYLAFY